MNEKYYFDFESDEDLEEVVRRASIHFTCPQITPVTAHTEDIEHAVGVLMEDMDWE